jgi:hypothetical protein
MKKKKCEICGKTFSRPTEKEAAQALRGHLISSHKETIKPDTELSAKQLKKREYNRYYNAKRRAESRGETPPTWGKEATPKPGPGRPRRSLSPDQQERRKAYLVDYRRRKKARQNTMRNGSIEGVHYCPRCGFNMQILATAIAVVEKV